MFENLSLYYRGNEHSEDIAWYYGQCLLKSDFYYTAAYQFKTFAKRFPYSSRAEEALAALRSHPLGQNAALIGRAEAASRGRVTLMTALGSQRILTLPEGEQLPRIC